MAFFPKEGSVSRGTKASGRAGERVQRVRSSGIQGGTDEEKRGPGEIRLKRVYDPPSPDDGLRVLVERLWPRGLTKEQAKVELWLKEVAPSTQLRQWYGHDPAKWPEFRRRYVEELRGNPAVGELRRLLKEHPVTTFVFAARDPERCSAAVLKEFLTGAL